MAGSYGFKVDNIISYVEKLSFNIDSWSGRIRVCRGIGASLPIHSIREFDIEHRNTLIISSGVGFESILSLSPVT